MKVAIVGAGHIARIHAPAIVAQPGNEIVAIVDPDLSRASALAEALAVPHAYENLALMLDERKPDVVHVVTPPQQHADVSVAAMERGCHVLVEKPMALTSDEARRMIEAAEKNNVRLCVNHSMVYETTIQRALALAKEGVLGEIISVDVQLVFDPNRMPAYVEEGAEHSHWIYRLNGGPLEDLMPHPLSIVLDLLDDVDNVQFLSSRMGALPSGWDDEIKGIVSSGKKMGTVSVSLNERPDTMKVTINGRKGRALADPFTGSLIVQEKSCLPRAAVRGLSSFRLARQYSKAAWSNVFRFAAGRIDKSNGIGPLIARFYEALRDNTDMPITVERALRAVEIMERFWPAKPCEEQAEAPVAHPTNDGPLVLVTGGSGFLGIHLVKRLLSENYRVRVLTRKNSLHTGRLKGLNVEAIEGDLSDAESVERAVKGTELVFHLGADMSNDFNAQQRVTGSGTRHVVQSALKHEVKRLVHVSSLVVYETLSVDSGKLLDEDAAFQSEPGKMGGYATSKIQAERTVTDAVRNDGLNAVIVRPGMILGPMSRIFYPHLGYRLGTDVFIPVGRGHTILPLVYVDNCVAGIIQAATAEEAKGKAYNLVDDGKISVNEFLQKFKEVTGSEARIVHMPYFAAWLLALAYEIAAGLRMVKKGVTSRAQLRWKQKSVYFDNTRAAQDLGYKSTISLNEGMEKTFKWYADKYGV